MGAKDMIRKLVQSAEAKLPRVVGLVKPARTLRVVELWMVVCRLQQLGMNLPVVVYERQPGAGDDVVLRVGYLVRAEEAHDEGEPVFGLVYEPPSAPKPDTV